MHSRVALLVGVLMLTPLEAAAPAARSLVGLEPAELETLFRNGTVGCLPRGLWRGKVLYVCEAGHPRARARMQGMVWKGKYFHGDGRMTNQWLGLRAVDAPVSVGASWLDGNSCIVLDYPEDAAVFGNTRDELREIAPGVLLGRFIERCPCRKLKGYFVLEADCRCK